MEDEIFDGDDNINEAAHSKLLSAVTHLETKQRVKPSSRNEPSLEVSEFHLVKSGSGNHDAVHLLDLAGALGDSSSLSAIKQKIRATKRRAKTLPKPVEKPEANRIDRTVRYENVKKQLNRWDSVVQTNRLSENLSFPLKQPNLHQESSSEFLKKFKPQTPLEIEISEILNEGKSVPEVANDGESEFPLSLQELTNRRNELSKLRAKQWYHEAKAARQKKIKSKKFHRIMRKEKVKEQLKDFEALKKTDPEAALQRLELLDKTRAEERASLRHRSTGKWARNRAVRAKYDEESRKVLAQQLSISRELTQKIRRDGSSEDEEDDPPPRDMLNPDDNPWVESGLTASAEVSQFVNGYCRYRDQQISRADESNHVRNELTAKKIEPIEDIQIAEEEIVNLNNRQQETSKLNKTKITKEHLVVDTSVKKNSKTSTLETNHLETLKIQPSKRKKDLVVKNVSSKSDVGTNNTAGGGGREPKQKKKKTGKSCNKSVLGSKKMNKELKVIATNGNWTVTDASDSESTIASSKAEKKSKKRIKNKVPLINVEEACDLSKKLQNKRKVPIASVEEMFDDIDKKFQKKLDKKLNNIKSQLSNMKASVKVTRKTSTGGKKKVGKHDDLGSSLAFKKQASRPVLDEELIENTSRLPSAAGNQITVVANLEAPRADAGPSTGKQTASDIDPNRFLAIKPKHLKTQLPDLVTAGEDAMDDDVEQHMTITEAFAEDDVVAEFRKEKDETVSASRGKDIDLSMPGWGQWGGKNLPTLPKGRRGKKHLIIKKPVEPPRKDCNKGDVIINEKKDDKVKEHLVNALPFPFTSVKSFEASIRAPIGNTWVPETSFRKLIAPRIQTKLGAIIQPMDQEELVDVNKRSTKWI